MEVQRQKDEIASFKDLWAWGYFEGDPLDPHAQSSYSAYDVRNQYSDQSEQRRDKQIPAEEIGFLSCVYVAYVACIRPFLKGGMSVLEIGPGRGAWSKAMLAHDPWHLHALDALSAEHNAFFEYVGARDNVSYTQVTDFSCSAVEDNSIDFFFSFGVFCHISREGTEEYFQNVFKKMRSNTHGFVLISDYDKFARALGQPAGVDLDHEDTTPNPGRWYHIGTDWFCGMMKKIGFEIVDPDTGVNIRDPVVHFRRPPR